jgi:hypothetical protein
MVVVSLSDSVALLAGILVEHVKSAMPAERDALHVLDTLARMPRYRAERRLDLWESDVLAAWPHFDSPHRPPALVAAASAIFDLGHHDLWGALQPGPTRERLQVAVERLRALGCTVTLDRRTFDVSDW